MGMSYVMTENQVKKVHKLLDKVPLLETVTMYDVWLEMNFSIEDITLLCLHFQCGATRISPELKQYKLFMGKR